MLHMRIIVITALLLSFAPAETELPSEQDWDFREVCRMESADHWTGPWNEYDIKTSSDAIEGNNCIEVNLSVLPKHHIRIERNFVCDCYDGFRNMMAFGMVDEDFSAYHTITFQYKTDIQNMQAFIFRIYDREGGWLQWEIHHLKKTTNWRKVTLSIPIDSWPKFNHHRVGGFVWEINAGNEKVDGKIWLDDLKLLPDTTQGIKGKAHRIEKINHNISINPPNIKHEYPDNDVHLIMNMSGEIGIAMAEHKTDLAIKRLSDAVSVFKDVRGLEYFFAAEAWRVKKKPTVEELSSGKYPDPNEWLAKSHNTYVEMSQWCEKNHIPFYIGIALSADHVPIVPPETIQACLKQAPEYCRGVVMGEYSIESNGGIDEVVEVMKLLKQYNLKLLYYQQSSYWFGILMPHGNEFRDRILCPEFKDVFVPMWENLLPSAQGLCLGSILGMWKSGMVSDWGASVQSWGYTNMNWGGTSDQPGHIWLRTLLSVISFGGHYIEIEPKWVFDGENVPGQIAHFKQWAHNLRWVGRRRPQVDIDLDPSGPMRALQLVNNLLRNKAVIPAPGPDNVLSVSPAVIRLKHTKDWGKWNFFHRGTDDNFYDYCCPNYTEMSAPGTAE